MLLPVAHINCLHVGITVSTSITIKTNDHKLLLHCRSVYELLNGLETWWLIWHWLRLCVGLYVHIYLKECVHVYSGVSVYNLHWSQSLYVFQLLFNGLNMSSIKQTHGNYRPLPLPRQNFYQVQLCELSTVCTLLFCLCTGLDRITGTPCCSQCCVTIYSVELIDTV